MRSPSGQVEKSILQELAQSLNKRLRAERYKGVSAEALGSAMLAEACHIAVLLEQRNRSAERFSISASELEFKYLGDRAVEIESAQQRLEEMSLRLGEMNEL